MWGIVIAAALLLVIAITMIVFFVKSSPEKSKEDFHVNSIIITTPEPGVNKAVEDALLVMKERGVHLDTTYTGSNIFRIDIPSRGASFIGSPHNSSAILDWLLTVYPQEISYPIDHRPWRPWVSWGWPRWSRPRRRPRIRPGMRPARAGGVRFSWGSGRRR